MFFLLKEKESGLVFENQTSDRFFFYKKKLSAKLLFKKTKLVLDFCFQTENAFGYHFLKSVGPINLRHVSSVFEIKTNLLFT